MMDYELTKSRQDEVNKTIKRLDKSGDRQAAVLIEWLAECLRDAVADLKHQVETELRWAIQGLEDIDPRQAKKHLQILENSRVFGAVSGAGRNDGRRK